MYKNPNHRMTLQCSVSLARFVSLIGKTQQLIKNETTWNDCNKCSKSFRWKSLQTQKCRIKTYEMRIGSHL